MNKEKLSKEVSERYKLASDSYKNQLDREVGDLEFQIPELMWSVEARNERGGGRGEGSPTPPRPILSIPKIQQPVQLILNQERAAQLGVQIHPLSEDANLDTAEVIQGLYRKIERDSNAYSPSEKSAYVALGSNFTLDWYRMRSMVMS